MHALQSEPNGLRAGGIGPFPIHVAAELRHHAYEDAQCGGLRRRVRATDYLPHRFPLGGLEHRFATDLRTTPAQTAYVQRPPSHDHVHCQTSQQPVHEFKQPLFDAAAGLQHAKVHFDHPPHTIILDDLPHLLDVVDRQVGNQQPLHGLLARRRIQFADQHHVHRHGRQCAVVAPRRPQCDACRTHRDLALARLPRLSPTARFTSHFRLAPAYRNPLLEQDRLFQEMFPQMLFYGSFAVFAEQRAVLTRAHNPLHALRFRRRLDQQFVNVRFAVRQTDELRGGRKAAFLARLPERVHPTTALFLFDGNRGTLGTRQRWAVRLFRAGPRLCPDGSQRRAVRREGVQHMQQRAAPRIAVQQPGAGHLLFRPGHVDFRGVLGQQHHRLCGQPRPRRIDVRLQDVVEGRTFVGNQAVGSLRLGTPATRRRNACRRTRPQLGEHNPQAFVQPFVVEVRGFHFIHDPRGVHERLSFTRFTPRRLFPGPP